ncbi:MAG: DUF2461 domain-containing protein [Chlorobi bacterium]|nr:DUF2461 domain-containing protein [Chlorobiota bacterium]
MKYFNQDFINFFKELNKNNNRDWFNENKQRYIESVKGSVLLFHRGINTANS